MTRKLLLSLLAVIPAALMPPVASGQMAKERPARNQQSDVTYKWEGFAGYGYTSLNQVNQSRYGLQGFNLSITRDWGKYFGITADGASYSHATSAGNPCPTPAPCNASVDAVLFGPVIHVNIVERLDGFFHVLLGGEHTGGEQQTPNISFAGGAGGGLDYKLTPHFALRASGDSIVSSFSVIGNNPSLNYSPHARANARAAVGVVYKF